MEPIVGAMIFNAALGAANSLSQNKQQIKQLKQQAALKNLEGDIYERNAKIRATADAYNEEIARNERAEKLARLRVVQAQSGVTGGTLIEIQMRSEREAELDDVMTRYNNHSQYVATLFEAQKARTEAAQMLENAKSLKKNRLFSAVLAGAGGAMSTPTSSSLFSKE